MADSESNPAYLIIGIVSTLVLVFFVGNIWAYVLPAPRPAAWSARGTRPAVSHASRPSNPAARSFGLTLSTPRFRESGTTRPRSSTPRSRRRRWAPRNARARCSRRACSRRESRFAGQTREEFRKLSPRLGGRIADAIRRRRARRESERDEEDRRRRRAPREIEMSRRLTHRARRSKGRGFSRRADGTREYRTRERATAKRFSFCIIRCHNLKVTSFVIRHSSPDVRDAPRRFQRLVARPVPRQVSRERPLLDS